MNERFDHRDAHLAEVLAKAQFGPGFAVATCDPREWCGGLYPVEAEAVARAVSSRMLEFQAGRSVARKAMQRLGMPPAAIPAGRDRAPVWPDSLVGSISHCNSVCIAVVALNRTARSVGIDVESATPLDADLLDIICSQDELNRMAPCSTLHARVLAKLIFSAKESVYKAQFALSRMVFDYHGLSVDIDTEDQTFTAEFQIGVPPFPRGYRWPGRFAASERLIVTSAVLAPDAVPDVPLGHGP